MNKCRNLYKPPSTDSGINQAATKRKKTKCHESRIKVHSLFYFR